MGTAQKALTENGLISDCGYAILKKPESRGFRSEIEIV